MGLSSTANLLLVFALCWAAAAPAAELKISDPEPARDGETCIVCGTELTAETGVAYLVDGQRFAVSREMQDEFLARPAHYTARYRPATMLFSGDTEAHQSQWALLIGLYLLLGIICAGWNGQTALRKGLDPWKWSLAGLLLTVPAVIALAGRPAHHAVTLPHGLRKACTTAAPVPCPECGNTNHPAAHECSVCHAQLSPEHPSETDTWLRGRH